MQNRMKAHPLTTEQMHGLLRRAENGCLATVNADGYPYNTPVHFWHHEGALYLHGLPKGRKIENIKMNPRVSLAVFEMTGLLLDPDKKPCDTNTGYQSVIVTGNAALVEDPELKKEALAGIVAKYTPQLAGEPLPENMLSGTAVIRVKILQMTGKYYD